MRTTVSADRTMPVPAGVVYHCLADYQDHHRPSGFLPPEFSEYVVESGGVGAGTVFSCVIVAGGSRTPVTCAVSEPEPGSRIVEQASNMNLHTTFTVDDAAGGSRVRIETVIDEGGVRGLLNRMFVPRLLAPIYRDELRRLEEYAAAHSAFVPGEVPVADGMPR